MACAFQVVVEVLEDILAGAVDQGARGFISTGAKKLAIREAGGVGRQHVLGEVALVTCCSGLR